MKRRLHAVAALALSLVSCPSRSRADVQLEGCPPWCPVPHVKEKVSPRAKGRWWPGFAMRALSFSAADERTRFGASDRTAASVGVEERALAYMTLGSVSARYTDFLALGGGGAGVDGGLGLDAAVGLRPLLGDRHGPFARIGVRAHYLYRGHFHTSLLELPQLQLGYSYIGRALHLEAGVRGGPALTGRYGLEGAKTTDLDGSLEVGAFLGFGMRPLRLDLEASRVRLDPGPEGPVESLQALLCGVLSRPTICFKSSAMRGDLAGGGGFGRATAVYIGVTLGIGPVEWR